MIVSCPLALFSCTCWWGIGRELDFIRIVILPNRVKREKDRGVGVYVQGGDHNWL